MNTKERFSRIFGHKEADRVPILDYPWEGTLKRWIREGMPSRNYVDYFDLDKVANIGVDNSPRFEEKVLEETEKYKIYTTGWGATLKSLKEDDSTPEFIDFTIKGEGDWQRVRDRINDDWDRINWDYLKENYPKWQGEGYWIQAGLWFGFDVTHSWIVGTERFLIAMAEEPQWCMDMFSHMLDVNLKLLDMIWDKGYRFDAVRWPDDMGYKNNQFFSLNMYRELLLPFHKKAVDWAHNKGIKAHLHSCGDINPFVEDLVKIGVDALNPLEIKAGMDPIHLKNKYKSRLVLHGGINAVLWDDIDLIMAEIERVLPILKESGGYIFASDHSIPNTVSLDNFTKIIKLVKSLGSY